MKTKNKPTLILGASSKKHRYAYYAAERLAHNGHKMFLVGNRKGEVLGETIHDEPVNFEGVDTITMYLSAKNQLKYYDYIIGLNPKRVIFNPGAENSELEKILDKNGIAHENACTLVLLSMGEY